MTRVRDILTGRLVRVALVLAALTLAADVVVEALGLRYCQPISHGPMMPAWVYQQSAGGYDVVFLGSSRVH